MSDYNNRRIVELARELSPEDLSLAKEVKQEIKNFVEEGNKYEAGSEDDMDFYVIEVEQPTKLEIGWDTLIEGLIERGKIVEIELRADPSYVAWDIDQLMDGLPPDPAQDYSYRNKTPDSDRWKWLEAEGRRNVFPHVFLKEVQHRVIGPDKILARLEDQSSCEDYQICLIDAFQYEKIEKLVQETNYGRITKVEDINVTGVF